MAELPWKSFAQPVSDREYVAILTYLPLTSFWALPQFFYHTGRIQSQLKSAPGLIGYSLVAHVVAKRFWTLSVWEDEAALGGIRSSTAAPASHERSKSLHGRQRVYAVDTQGRGGATELARSDGADTKEGAYRFYGIAPK